LGEINPQESRKTSRSDIPSSTSTARSVAFKLNSIRLAMASYLDVQMAATISRLTLLRLDL
jgi:hypothetical protein